MSKVTSINLDTEVEVYRLEENLFDIKDFKCSNKIYEDYIKKEACDDQRNMIAQTWVFVYKNVNVIGYASIAMGNLNKTQHEKLRGFPHTNVPGLLLGRLATHKDFECLGVGKNVRLPHLTYDYHLTARLGLVLDTFHINNCMMEN